MPTCCWSCVMFVPVNCLITVFCGNLSDFVIPWVWKREPIAWLFLGLQAACRGLFVLSLGAIYRPCSVIVELPEQRLYRLSLRTT